jgi:hypothetical protein
VGQAEIAANAVGKSELQNNAVDTDAIEDQAVTSIIELRCLKGTSLV